MINEYFYKTCKRVKTIEENGEVYFSVPDVLRAIGRDPKQAYSVADRVREGHIKKFDVEVTRTNQYNVSTRQTVSMNFIDETALYVITGRFRALGNKEVEDFCYWVGDVLKSIRKNGGYIDGQEKLPDEDRKAYEETIRNMKDLCDRLVQENKSLEEEAERLLELTEEYERDDYRNAYNDYVNQYE